MASSAKRRVFGLVEAAISDASLTEAWYKVRANNGRSGTDGVTVEAFGRRLFEHLGRLRTQVQSGSYVPRPLLQASIPRDGKAPRLLAIPAVRDRVLQAAVAHVLTPVLDPTFEDSSFAYRAGRSTRMAIEQVIRLRNDGWRWVVDADIHAFFDEINHTMLLAKLQPACHDEGVVTLVRRWLETPIRRKDGHLIVPERGIGQGSPLSPLLANLYLDAFDEFVEAKGWRLVRFADDFIVFCRKREDAEVALELTEEALSSLALRFAPDKTRLTHFSEGFVFLGVRFEDDSALAQSPGAAPWLQPEPRTAFTTGTFSLTTLGEELRLARGAQGKPAVAADSETAAAPAEDINPPWASTAPMAETCPVDDRVPPHLRTLYLLSPSLSLLRSGERLAVAESGETLREVPIHTIDQVIALGHCMLSSSAIALCADSGVGLHVLRPSRQLAAHMLASTPSAILLRRDQFRATEDPAFCLAIAKALVAAKIGNSQHVLRRFLRHHPLDNAEEHFLLPMEQMASRALTADTLDEVRGCEGNAAARYFAALRGMLPKEWSFGARIAHPPEDAVNALLSYGYAVLYGNAATVLARRGLDLAFGFLHAPSNGHAALASDLMEPYRAAVVDSVVLTLIFRRRLKPDDFDCLPGRELPTQMSGHAKRVLIHGFEEKINSRPGSEPLDFRRLLARDASGLATLIENGGEWSPFAL